MYHVRRRETVETIMVPHQPMNNQHHPPMHMNVNKFRNLFKKNHLMITSEVQKQNIINHLVHDNTFSSDAENTYNNSVILSSTPNGPKRSLQDFPSRVSVIPKRTPLAKNISAGNISNFSFHNKSFKSSRKRSKFINCFPIVFNY